MIVVEINNRTYSLPSNWNELTAKQLVKVLRVLDSNTEVTAARVMLLKILSGMGWWRFRQCDPDQLQDLLYLTDFLIQENTLTRNLIPKYKGFYGPANAFNNLRLDEFVFCEDYFLRWKEAEGDTTLLNALVACLYREGKKGYNKKLNEEGDVRVRFNENICGYNAAWGIGYWPLEIKKAIAFWYEGCRAQLVNDFKEVFEGGSGEPAKYGLISVMMGVAETGTFGTFGEVEKQYVRMLMMKMDDAMREAKQLAKQNS